jgi:transposase
VLGRATAQGSLLETRVMRRHLVTRGSFYERLADHGHEIIDDATFAHLYSARMGRPSIPPSVMVRAMLCATNDRTSDAETSRRTRVDADWKAAMGVDDEFEGIAATTFSLMRRRMITVDAEDTLLEATLAKAVEAGIFKEPLTAIIDSSPVVGAGAVADTYELIRDAMRRVIRAGGQRLSAGTHEEAERFCGAKPDIDWHDRPARKAHLGDLVAVARKVVAEVVTLGEGDAMTPPAALLAQIVDQDVETGDDGDPQLRQGVAVDRVVSVSDPEMRHGRKSATRRFDGHKMDVMTDENSEMILGVDVRAGNAGDGQGAAPLLEQVQHTTGVKVNTLLADMAYSDGEVREAVEALGADLVAKVPPLTNSGRFTRDEFFIEADQVTCPAGEVTKDLRVIKDHKARPAFMFVFAAHVCQACPLRAECTAGKGGRTITIGPHHERMEAARAAQNEPATKALLRRRAKVERKIDHLQDLGMRKARYKGRRKTRLQAVLAATVANIKRLDVLGAFPEATLAAA